MLTIHVVIGSTGEYSDRVEWPVVAYKDFNKAAEHIARAQARADEWAALPYSEQERVAEQHNMIGDYPPPGWNPYDVKMEVRNNEVRYYMMIAPLQED